MISAYRQQSPQALLLRLRIIVKLGLIGHLGPIFADRNLDSLLRKAFAEFGAFNDTRKLFRGVDGKRFGEVDGEAGAFAFAGAVHVDGAVCAVAGANVEEAELQGKGAFGAHAEVLEYEPEAGLAFEVVEAAGIDGVHAD